MAVAQNTSPIDAAYIIPVDAEHSGIRTAGCFTFFISAAVAFFLVNALMQNAAIFGVIFALLAGAGITYAVDRILKANWPSGRFVVVATDTLEVKQHERTERSINPQQNVNPLMWRFEIKRSGRARKGWYVVACSLEQDGEYIPVYTFASPEDYEQMPLAEHFAKLEKPKGADKSKTSDLRRAGQQRRLYDAERDRGDWGAEMRFDEFCDFIQHLQQAYPDWMPQT